MKNKRRPGIVIMFSLIKLLGKLAYIIILAVFGGYLGNACAIAVMGFGAASVAKIIDPDFISWPLGLLVGLTIGSGVLRGLLRFLEQYNNHYIAFKLLASLRDKIFGALRKLAPAKLEGKNKGDIISMLTADVETLEVFYAHTISPIMIAILVDGTVFVLVSVIGNIWMGLCALGAYLLIGIAVPFVSSAVLKNDGVTYRKTFAESSSYFLDSVKGIADIVQNGNEGERKKSLAVMSEEMNEKTYSIKKKGSRASAISQIIVSLTVLLVLFVGILCVNRNELTLSRMIVAMVLVFSSFGPVLSLANLPGNLTQTFASGNRILDFMEEKPETAENEEGEKFVFDGLSVNDVSFSYQETPVLKNVNLKVNKGDIVGLVGESGCGKSTLLKLLLRFYDPKEGSVTYGEKNLKDINCHSLHKNAVMVSQDTYLFDDTILNNLLFVRPDATMEEVREACRKASVDDFIMSLEKGYDTEAGLLGDSLSAGEKQRIGLARAFLSGAPLILLDEVTSNVDAINEGMILKSLVNKDENTTIILVSHRESTVAICNKIVHMEGGVLS